MQNLDKLNYLGQRLGLESIGALLNCLDNPQKKLRIVHVAGTNGKGSTISYLSSIAKAFGQKAGSYTSPCLIDYKENICINGKQITQSDAGMLLKQIFDACALIEKQGYNTPTRFEVETALALLYFYKEKCDIVFFEVGLGGASDATNIIDNPILTVFTQIGIDHKNEFGDTIDKIANAEFSIIRSSVPVISAEQLPEVKDILQKECASQNSLLEVSGDYVGQLNSSASYAKTNAGLAKAVAKRLGYTDDAIASGIVSAKWHGRFSVVGINPDIILDGAHNAPAVSALVESLKQNYASKNIINGAKMLACKSIFATAAKVNTPPLGAEHIAAGDGVQGLPCGITPFIFIVGIYKDKEYDLMLKKLATIASKIITVELKENSRLVASCDLQKIAAQYCKSSVASKDIKSALKLARQFATKNDTIVVTGSLSIVGAVIRTHRLMNR